MRCLPAGFMSLSRVYFVFIALVPCPGTAKPMNADLLGAPSSALLPLLVRRPLCEVFMSVFKVRQLAAAAAATLSNSLATAPWALLVRCRKLQLSRTCQLADAVPLTLLWFQRKVLNEAMHAARRICNDTTGLRLCCIMTFPTP